PMEYEEIQRRSAWSAWPKDRYHQVFPPGFWVHRRWKTVRSGSLPLPRPSSALRSERPRFGKSAMKHPFRRQPTHRLVGKGIVYEILRNTAFSIFNDSILIIAS